jgi:hypothetical protein
MATTIDWFDIALRLALSGVASAVIGANRGEHDRPVGLRTTMLVSLSLAATISMIQVNLLLPIAGKSADSFVVMDLMRLHILSGMGFIGAGANGGCSAINRSFVTRLRNPITIQLTSSHRSEGASLETPRVAGPKPARFDPPLRRSGRRCCSALLGVNLVVEPLVPNACRLDMDGYFRPLRK